MTRMLKYYALNSEINSFFYPSYFIWRIKTTDKKLFLTFDDGPTEKHTHYILNCLDKYAVKGHFFCLGKQVEKHQSIFNEILSQGHVAGNHTYSHRNGWKTSLHDYVKDIEKAGHFINSDIFRPPYGRITYKQAAALKNKFRIIMWSCLTADYEKKMKPEQCLNLSLRIKKPGSIIVFHDSDKASENLRYVLPRFIERCVDEGYKFSILNHFL